MIKVLLDLKNVSYDKANEEVEKNSILKNLFANGKEVLKVEDKYIGNDLYYTVNEECDNRIYQIQEVFSIKNKDIDYKRLLILDITDALQKKN